MTATFLIEHDFIGGTEVGRTLPFDFKTGKAHRVSLIDGDKITYYTGSLRVSDGDLDAAVSALCEWGTWYAGTTSIKVDGKVWI